MEGNQAERRLGFLYLLAAIFSSASTTCFLITWQYWSRTLNGCREFDCGCILYGVTSFRSFMGGDIKSCQFVSFSVIPAIFIGFILGFYHTYRTCFSRNFDEPKVFRRVPITRDRNEVDTGDVIVITPKSRSPCKQWMLPTFLAALIFFLSLAHVVIISDGYWKTCDQYRTQVIGLLGSQGYEAQAIHERLSCSAILDYMDYIQPDANNWARGDKINTSILLQVSLISSWLHLFSWIFIFIVNFVMARQMHRSLGGKSIFCCF